MIILCHPNPESYCGHLAKAISTIPEDKTNPAVQPTYIRDLYRENFNPVLDEHELARHTSFDKLVSADMKALGSTQHLIFVFPLWWGGMPAMLKGWIDRVFRPETAYCVNEQPNGTMQQAGMLEGLSIHAVVCSDDPSPLGPDHHYEWKPIQYLENPLAITLCEHIARFCQATPGLMLWCGSIRSTNFTQRQNGLSAAAAFAKALRVAYD